MAYMLKRWIAESSYMSSNFSRAIKFSFGQIL